MIFIGYFVQFFWDPRWVIDFNDRSETAAKTYLLPYERVRDRVKRERAKKAKAVRQAPWWLFLRARPAMRKMIAGLSDVIVIAQTSSTQIPLFVPIRQVFDQKLVVFASNEYSFFATVSSSPHRLWATCLGSTRTGDPVYTPSKVFSTFPRPEPTERLAEVGRTLDVERREIMLRKKLGLTKLYKLVNDPDNPDSVDADVARMREIHVELDRAVMDAYGWGDLPLEHGFHTYRQMRRWTVSPAARVEILDLLLEENHSRAATKGEAPPVDADDEGDDE